MTVEVFGVEAVGLKQVKLGVESGNNPQLVTIVWEEDRIEVEVEEEVTGPLVLIYNAVGWNTNVRSPESGGGVRLVRYCSATAGKVTPYALILVAGDGDIVLTDTKRKKHEFDFLGNGSLLTDDEGSDELLEDDED